MKALALFSGGLDSTLAIKVIQEQGVEVLALNFESCFCRCDKEKGCGSTIKKMADQLDVAVKIIHLEQDYLEMVKNPKHGYGRNLNPCIDCRIFKLKKAKEYMEQINAAFIITGEVLGQRPMSQHRQALEVIEKESGLERLILRPLSARLLPVTLAEEKGWVKREALFDISGRTRKPQISLASSFGIKDYPCPAGGCLLTDPEFSRRLKDTIKYDQFTINNINLLKTGRYFRVDPSFHFVVGRDENENNRLLRVASSEDIIFEPAILPGPTGVGRGNFNKELVYKCSRIIAWYTDKENAVKVKVKCLSDRSEQTLEVKATTKEVLEESRI